MATRHETDMLGGGRPMRLDVDSLDAPAFHLLDAPLDYFLAEHMRQRAAGAFLRKFASERKALCSEADRVVAFLTHDVPLHYSDEEEDLFPALRRRAHSEDNLGPVLARLCADDRRSKTMIDDIAERLSRHSGNEAVRIDKPTQELMQAYAAGEHRHIAIENAVVLSIAGVRLNRSDLRAISKGMKARRGVTG